MKLSIFLLLAAISTPAMARHDIPNDTMPNTEPYTEHDNHSNAYFGLQVFTERGEHDAKVYGANLLFSGDDEDGRSLLYVGLGIKKVDGYSDDTDGHYTQILVGLSLPWVVSPYVEIGLDPIDLIEAAGDDDSHGVNASFGIGAKVSLNRHVALDVGYKYHHFSNEIRHGSHHHHQGSDQGFSTAGVSLSMLF
ncbi:MAG: opacity protein-like surface antigen [Phenylobacterium sp.]|jgi:opacity protein-like surface antigen